MHKVPNYGSVLQTYASMKVFQDLGLNAEVIDYCPDRFKAEYRLQDEYNRLTFKHKNTLVKIFFSIIMKASLNKQTAVFDGFLTRFVKLTHRYNTLAELEELPPEADIYCTGSDQVWNTKTNGFVELPFYLSFVNNGGRKIAFSASFGRDRIDVNEKMDILPWLKQYYGIGIREKSGESVLSEMGIRNYKNTLDPTLTVDVTCWKELASTPNKKLSKYILIYEFNKNEKINRVAEKLAKETGCQIVRISYWYHKRQSKQKCIVLPEVDEFLGLIKNASYVVTNSFHAVAFSTIFKRQFVAIAPKAFSVRISDYLKLVGLKEYYIASEDQYLQCMKSINYDDVHKKIKDERIKTLSFLKDIVGME